MMWSSAGSAPTSPAAKLNSALFLVLLFPSLLLLPFFAAAQRMKAKTTIQTFFGKIIFGIFYEQKRNIRKIVDSQGKYIAGAMRFLRCYHQVPSGLKVSISILAKYHVPDAVHFLKDHSFPQDQGTSDEVLEKLGRIMTIVIGQVKYKSNSIFLKKKSRKTSFPLLASTMGTTWINEIAFLCKQKGFFCWKDFGRY